MRRSILAALIAVLLIAAPVTSAPSPDVEGSVALVDPTLAYGDFVSFDETYPQDAAKQSRQPQYPGSPQTQVDCWQDGVRIYRIFLFPLEKEHISGGWHAITNAMELGWKSPGTAIWWSGAASCRAILFSYDAKNVSHIWAWLSFEVGA